ncbi:MAG: MFS transporter [Deltaproteobacteria bacterium]|nr:MFS transporter [Deltaproteobacteria bacterium]
MSQAPEPILTRPFLALVGAHFLQALGYASLLLLPLYLAHLGASRTEIGAIVAVSSVSGLVARPVVGWAIDTLGRRPTLTAGTLVMASGLWLIFGVQDLGATLVLSRLLTGAGEGALFTGYFAFAADLIPESRRSEGIAIFGISGLIPIVVGPIVDHAGIDAPDLRFFLPVVGFGVAGSLLFLWRVPEASSHHEREPFSVRGTLTALSARPLIPVWVAAALFSSLVALFTAFVTVVAEGRGIRNPATLWFAYAGAAALVRTIGARIPDRIGPTNIVVPAIASYLVAFLIAAGAWSGEAFVLAGALGGIGHGYGFPVLTTQVVDRTPVRLRGSSMALYTALFALAALVLTPVFGGIADRWDDATMFSFAAVVGTAVLALWVALEHRLLRGS